jgi:hypothetical protein
MKTITLSSTVSSDGVVMASPVLRATKSPDRVFRCSTLGRVALVNDYEIVLEGLRAFLRLVARAQTAWRRWTPRRARLGYA